MVSEMAELAGDGGDLVLESVEVEEGPMAWPGVPTDPKDSKARNSAWPGLKSFCLSLRPSLRSIESLRNESRFLLNLRRAANPHAIIFAKVSLDEPPRCLADRVGPGIKRGNTSNLETRREKEIQINCSVWVSAFDSG